VNEPGKDSSETLPAMLECLTPSGRAIVLAFAAGWCKDGHGRDRVAVAVLHLRVLPRGMSVRDVARKSGLDPKTVRKAGETFARLMRRCIEREGLLAEDMIAPRVDDRDGPDQDGWGA